MAIGVNLNGLTITPFCCNSLFFLENGNIGGDSVFLVGKRYALMAFMLRFYQHMS